jgi:hypothetical protein
MTNGQRIEELARIVENAGISVFLTPEQYGFLNHFTRLCGRYAPKVQRIVHGNYEIRLADARQGIEDARYGFSMGVTQRLTA